MSHNEPRPSTAHLRAGGAAVVSLLMLCHPLLTGMEGWARSAQASSVSELRYQKNRGLSLMEDAFCLTDVLPLFGSSELFLERENRADCFFQNAPTGFRVCPIGAPGNTCLPTAEKIAALGHLVAGKKLAIMLSFRWFSFSQALPEEYAGNFSPMHASVLATNDRLAFPLRQKFASRMLHYPATLEERPALGFYLRSVSRSDGLTHALQPLLASWLNLENHVDRLQDRFESALNLLRYPPQRSPGCPLSRAPIEWKKIGSPQPPEVSLADYPDEIQSESLDAKSLSFVSKLDSSREWQDLELLLDTLTHLHGAPLILCIPLDGSSMDAQGISSRARSHFYRRVEQLCAERSIPCESFIRHDRDHSFTEGDGHPTPQGWLCIDQKLDDFYHGRLSSDAGRPVTQK